MTTIDPVLAKAIVAAQCSVRAALKTSTNEHHKYKYASAEEVLTVGREALNDNGLAMVPVFENFEPITPIDDKCGGAVALLRCKYLVIHETGLTYEFTTDVPVVPTRGNVGWARPADKSTFGARTEAIGYALRDLLLIPREDAPDVSGRADKGKAGPGTAEQQKQRKAAQENPGKSAAQYMIELKAITKFGAAIQCYQLAKRDIVTPEEFSLVESIFVEKFVAKIGACETIEAVEKDAATAARLIEGPHAETIAKAIEAARARIGAPST